MANFNPYQFANSHYSADYSQYGDGLFSPFSSQMFSQDSQPSNSQPSFDSAFEHGQPIQPSPAPSAASGGTKKSNQRERWGFDDEKVLLQLWADNIEKVESKDSRKAWEEICKLATEGEQMASVMERMQDSQAQQIQLMSQLVGCFNKYVENNKKS